MTNTIDEVGLRSLLRSGQARIVAGGLLAVVAAAWIYFLSSAGLGMEQMDMGGGVMMAMPPAWSAGYAALVFAMWAAMMAAMMLPGAFPAIVLRVHARPGKPAPEGTRSAILFASGYMLAWTLFGAAATALQWGLDRAHLLSASMAIGSQWVAGATVLAVGLYQLTPLKRTALRNCHASIRPLAGDPRGRAGTLRDGLRHGAACVACCWAIMTLAFVAGVMDATWIAVVTLWIVAEKNLPWADRLARLSAGGLIAWGCVLLAIAARSSS